MIPERYLQNKLDDPGTDCEKKCHCWAYCLVFMKQEMVPANFMLPDIRLYLLSLSSDRPRHGEAVSGRFLTAEA